MNLKEMAGRFLQRYSVSKALVSFLERLMHCKMRGLKHWVRELLKSYLMVVPAKFWMARAYHTNSD